MTTAHRAEQFLVRLGLGLILAGWCVAPYSPVAARDSAGRHAKKSRDQKSTVPPPASNEGVAPSIHLGPVLAPSYILVDVETGRVLAEHNSHHRMFPASTTKTMTALLALESGDLNRNVTVGPNPVATGESSLSLLLGESFKLHELIGAALVKSANDSCVAIAEAVGGSESAFVAMMNKRARELGAKDTHFVNPHGLHDPNHYSTAYDLSLIAREALRDANFNSIIATKQMVLHGNVKIGAQRMLVNRNRLLFRWNECDGVKTGYTRQAGRCLIATATRTDKATGRPWRLLSVVLHAPDSWSDSYNLMNQEGFAKYQPTLLMKADQTVTEAPVDGGGTVPAGIEADAVVPLLASETGHIILTPRLRKVRAPLAKGTKVGNLVFMLNGEKIGYVPLIAREDAAISVTGQLSALARGKWSLPSSLPLPRSRRQLATLAITVGGVLLILVWRRLSHNARAKKLAASKKRRNVSHPPTHGARRKGRPSQTR